jgi:predicted transport protein
VTEEFLKLYVAYKAKTNFVDVVPQSKQLRLSLNMGFAEISDPKGLCKDVHGLGPWGNGDVEVRLASLDELQECKVMVGGHPLRHNAYNSFISRRFLSL